MFCFVASFIFDYLTNKVHATINLIESNVWFEYSLTLDQLCFFQKRHTSTLDFLFKKDFSNTVSYKCFPTCRFPLFQARTTDESVRFVSYQTSTYFAFSTLLPYSANRSAALSSNLCSEFVRSGAVLDFEHSSVEYVSFIVFVS